MKFKRSFGTLLHLTSVSTPYGIGDMGKAAYDFVDFLHDTLQKYWQILPLSPIGYGNSPYASYSAFACNIYLISLDKLKEKELLTSQDLKEAILPTDTCYVDYNAVALVKNRMFLRASKRFFERQYSNEICDFNNFCEQNAFWLDDYALFSSAREHFQLKPWTQWEQGLAKRNIKTITRYKKILSKDIQYQKWLQFEFHQQWQKLKTYANSRHISIMGDIPIFVDHNSVDVWKHPQYFCLNKDGTCKKVAGVPPDIFSEIGQRWGNPLYRWDILEKDNYSWWIKRIKHALTLYDVIRIDHFRGFDSYWEIDANESTAVNGIWKKGPGKRLLKTIELELGNKLPIIVEDLGDIGKSVTKLRHDFNLPGMKILQFAFDSNSTNPFLPHNYTEQCVVYTGTHDNDTSKGWYHSTSEIEKHHAREYMKTDGSEIHWDFIRLGMLSTATIFIVPLQDIMGLDSTHRMNFPGKPEGNWTWRYTPNMMKQVNRNRLKHLISYGNRTNY